jgi:outer membrane receptor protein involved in Fe transport
MRYRSLVLLTALAAGASSVASAQEAPTGPTSVEAAPQATKPLADRDVASYPATFFVDQRPNTAADMVSRLPGFTLDTGGNVRGFAGAAGNVLINGRRPTSKSDDLNSILTRIPATLVDHIDVIRGGAPGIDMQGKAVVANVILKSGSGFSGVAAVAPIWIEDGRVIIQYRAEGTWVNGETRTEAGLLGGTYVDDGTGPGPHVLRDNTGAITDTSHQQARAGGLTNALTGAWQAPLAGGKFRANFQLQDQTYVGTFADTFVNAGKQYEKDDQDRTNGELGLHWDRALGSKASIELIGLQQLSHMGYTSNFTTPSETDFFGLRTTGGESIARAVLHYAADDRLSLEGGGEFAYNWVNTHTVFLQNGAGVALPGANVLVDEKRGEVFTNATWRATPKFTVEAGVRVEDSVIESSGDVVLSKSLIYPKPRLLLTWAPDADNQVRLRVEREVGQLDFGSFVATSALNGSGVQAGNPNLNPSQDWAFEAAYERHFWGKGAVVLTARHLILKDVIDRAPITSPSGVFDAPANIGGGTENDILLSVSLPLDRFHIPGGMLSGVGTWRFSRVTDPTTGESREISGQHQLDGELHFTQDLPRWKLNWGIDAFRGWTEHYYRFNEIDTNKLGTFDVVWVEYKARPDLSYRWEIDNAGRRGFVLTRREFAGVRAAGATPDLTDTVERNFGLEIKFRIRKTFG